MEKAEPTEHYNEERHKGASTVRPEHNQTPWEPVGGHSSNQEQGDCWNNLDCYDQTHSSSRAGKEKHKPDQRNARYTITQDRDALPHPEQGKES